MIPHCFGSRSEGIALLHMSPHFFKFLKVFIGEPAKFSPAVLPQMGLHDTKRVHPVVELPEGNAHFPRRSNTPVKILLACVHTFR